MWAAGRWRDPPRERWALTARPEQEAADRLGKAEYRIRRAYGLRDEARWRAVRRAVDRGETAPDGLGPAAHEWAGVVLADLGPPHSAAARVFALQVAVLVLAVAGAAWLLGTGSTVLYGLYAAGVLAARNPWTQDRKRTRAETARTTNHPT